MSVCYSQLNVYCYLTGFLIWAYHLCTCHPFWWYGPIDGPIKGGMLGSLRGGRVLETVIWGYWCCQPCTKDGYIPTPGYIRAFCVLTWPHKRRPRSTAPEISSVTFPWADWHPVSHSKFSEVSEISQIQPTSVSQTVSEFHHLHRPGDVPI